MKYSYLCVFHLIIIENFVTHKQKWFKYLNYDLKTLTTLIFIGFNTVL